MPKKDVHLLEALTKAYTARAKLFHRGVSEAKIDFLIAEIDSIDPASLPWKLDTLGISRKAFKRVQARDWFNLTSILGDQGDREQFLDRLFHIVQTPTKRRRK